MASQATLTVPQRPAQIRSGCRPGSRRHSQRPAKAPDAVVQFCAVALLCLLVGCGSLGGPIAREGAALRISEVDDGGDPRRRASLRLVARGLDLDSMGQPARAQSEYERAIQVDANNAYAYLALARHLLERGEHERALNYLDQAEVLLRADAGNGQMEKGRDARTREMRRVRPHLDGMRAAAYAVLGAGGETHTLLERARRQAPDIWDDGRLSADELR